VNLVPVISKADILTDGEIARFKKRVICIDHDFSITYSGDGV
jgi:septin family protein